MKGLTYHIPYNMNAFPPFHYFLLAILLLIAVKAPTNRSTEITKNSHAKRVVGAIIDSTSRIGKEQKVALEMAMEDFCEFSNQSFLLQIEDSHGEPIRAGLAGNSLSLSLYMCVCVGLNLLHRGLLMNKSSTTHFGTTNATTRHVECCGWWRGDSEFMWGHPSTNHN